MRTTARLDSFRGASTPGRRDPLRRPKNDWLANDPPSAVWLGALVDLHISDRRWSLSVRSASTQALPSHGFAHVGCIAHEQMIDISKLTLLARLPAAGPRSRNAWACMILTLGRGTQLPTATEDAPTAAVPAATAPTAAPASKEQQWTSA